MKDAAKKRKRKPSNHRWTESETLSLLQGIVGHLKSNPNKFEKPTASRFYGTICDDYNLPNIGVLGSVLVKNKMRHIKSLYLKADDFKQHTAPALLAKDEAQTVKDYMVKVCPHYDLCKQIFGTVKYDDGAYVSDSGTGSWSFEDMIDSETKDKESETRSLNDEVSNLINCNVEIYLKKISESVDSMVRIHEKRLKIEETKMKQSNESEEETMKKQLFLETEKLKYEAQVEEERIKLKRERLILEMQNHKCNIELKKIEIEQEYELGKYELELKYNITE